MIKLDKTTEEPSRIIPEGGTLGLLAYGYRGIMIWRQTRQEAMQARLANIHKEKVGNEEN